MDPFKPTVVLVKQAFGARVFLGRPSISVWIPLAMLGMLPCYVISKGARRLEEISSLHMEKDCTPRGSGKDSGPHRSLRKTRSEPRFVSSSPNSPRGCHSQPRDGTAEHETSPFTPKPELAIDCPGMGVVGHLL